MKHKLLYMFICISVLICCFSLTAYAGFDLTEDDIASMDKVESLDYCLATGDVTGDGEILADDARIILRISVNLEKIDTSDFMKADLDGDNSITAADARIALRLSVGLDPLPEHELEEIVIVPATCTTEGLTVRVCLRCLKLYAEVTVPASSEYHVVLDWTTVQKPNCIQAGLAQKICILCGEVLDEVELPATKSHSGEWNYPEGKDCLNPVKKNRTCTVCGTYEETFENPIGNHNFFWVTEQKNTCTEDGLEVYKCINCGCESRSQVTKAHGHIHEKDVVIKEPTCTNTGLKGDKCVYCDDVENQTEIPAKGHDYDNKHYKVTKEPTCSETGTANIVCSVCGDTREKELPKIAHTLTSDWVVTKAAKCTEDGKKEAQCAYCGQLEEVIPATGHTNLTTITATEPTCTEKGLSITSCNTCNTVIAETEIPATGHIDKKLITKTEPTCNKVGIKQEICTVCNIVLNEIEIPATNKHSGEWNYPDGKDCLNPVKKNRTCTVCGTYEETFENPIGTHNFYWVTEKENTCTEDGLKVYKCSICEYESKSNVIKAHGHSYVKDVTLTAPTCTLPGEKGEKCKFCNDVINKEQISSLGHSYDYDNPVITTNPTCQQTGTANAVCSACGDTKEIILDKTDHLLISDWTQVQEPTCTTEGKSEAQCKYCGKLQKDIPPTGHKVSWTVVKQATCSEEGLRCGTCSTCGDSSIEEVISKTEHSYGNEVTDIKGIRCKEDVTGYVHCTACGDKKAVTLNKVQCESDGVTHTYSEATCTKNKQTIEKCKYCGDDITSTMKSVKNSALGHAWSGWTQTQAPSCSEYGIEERTCSRCSESETRTIAKTDHAEGTWSTVQNASCTQPGSKELTCSNCGFVMETKEIPITEHTPKNTVIADSATVIDGNYTIKCNVVCAECGTVLKQEVTVTRIEVISDIELTFSDDSNINPGGTVYFELADTATEVLISYGESAPDTLEKVDGKYMFIVPDSIGDSDKITISVF